MRVSACAVFFAGLIILAGCTKPKPQETVAAAPSAKPGQIVLPVDSPKLAQIRVEEVRMKDVPSDEVTAPGKIEVNPNRVAHVVLPLPGRVASVNVRLGDSVHQGDTIVTIDSPDADAAMSAYLQSQSAITQAKAVERKSEADLERLKDLYQHNAVAQKEVLNAESTVTQAKSGLEQAEAIEKQALSRLQIIGLKPGVFGQKVAVKAPISGKVMEISVVPGEYRNDTNASLMTIADLSTVWVAADVPESSIRLIGMNERVSIELTAFPGETFRGRVARIADTVDPQTRTIKVRAEMDNSRGLLRPEMFGRIHHVEGMKAMPVLPAGAIVQGDGQSTVYKEIAPASFQSVPVTVGERAGDFFPILSGLKAGDRIVVDGAMLLK